MDNGQQHLPPRMQQPPAAKKLANRSRLPVILASLVVALLAFQLSSLKKASYLYDSSGLLASFEEADVIWEYLKGGSTMENSKPSPLAFPQQNNNTLEDLPAWIQHYFRWHNEKRKMFPDTRILTDKDAPGILVSYCGRPKVCGGLFDRIGSLAQWLLVANRTQRILLFKWHHPTSLETFLIPNQLNWTAPKHPSVSPGDTIKHRGKYRKWFEDIAATAELRNKTIDTRKIHPKIILDAIPPLHREKQFKELLLGMGEPDTINETPTFSNIFRALFQPSKRLQDLVRRELTKLKLVPGKYVATHCRVRHPGKWGKKRVQGKIEGMSADGSGLPWTGAFKNASLATGYRALQCANQLAKHNEPIYFYSDSDDLVKHIQNETSSESAHTQLAIIGDRRKVVTREIDQPLIHIDLGSRNVSDFETLSHTFLDLYLAVNARCISMGVGNFAYLAAKISGTRCLQYHEKMKTTEAKNWNQNMAGIPCILET